MECHPGLEVADRRKIRVRNVQVKVLLVNEQGRPLQVSTSFDNFDQFRPVSTSFDQFWPVLTSLDWFISLLITSKIQYFWGGSLLLPTSVLVFDTYYFKMKIRLTRLYKSSYPIVLASVSTPQRQLCSSSIFLDPQNCWFFSLLTSILSTTWMVISVRTFENVMALFTWYSNEVQILKIWCIFIQIEFMPIC